jgi:hypothetical protein
MCWLSKIFTGTIERPSPSDIVPLDSIRVVAADKLSLIIDLTRLNILFAKPPRVWIPDVPDTNSMIPNFDHEHNNILIAGADEWEHFKLIDFLKVGDIAVYRIMENSEDNPNDFSKPHRFYAIHRIVSVRKHNGAREFKFKGDNNTAADPWWVKEKEILWVSIGTIY